MSKLIVRRSSEWVNKMRAIGLYLNGKKIGTINDGETKEFKLEPGTHSLRAKIDWCGSENLNFSLEDGEIKKVELKSFKNGSWLMPLVLIAAILGFIFDHYFDFNLYVLVSIITIPSTVYILFFLTYRRNKYLQLKLKEF